MPSRTRGGPHRRFGRRPFSTRRPFVLSGSAGRADEAPKAYANGEKGPRALGASEYARGNHRAGQPAVVAPKAFVLDQVFAVAGQWGGDATPSRELLKTQACGLTRMSGR